MRAKVSKRLSDIIDALPIKNGMRILEIGCGTGAAAREIARRFGNIYLLGIDRSSKAIDQAIHSCRDRIDENELEFRKMSAETFHCGNDIKFDLAFAVRVGALDGRHPEIENVVLTNIFNALKPNGRLFTDGGDPVKEIFRSL